MGKCIHTILFSHSYFSYLMSRCPRCKSFIPKGETECQFCLKHFPESIEEKRAKDKRNQDSLQPELPIDTAIGYVGFWRRLGASTPDLMIAAIFVLIVNFVLELYKIPNPSLYAVLIAGAFFLILYSPLCLSSPYRATVGKIAFGIVVVYDNGKQLTFFRALVRELGKYLSLITAGIGFVMIGFTKNKQGLHDLLARTVVVDRTDGRIYHKTISREPYSGRKQLIFAALIIIFCILGSGIPLMYFQTTPSKQVSPQSFAAYSLSTTADTIADSKYPEYSLSVYDRAIEFQPNNTEIMLKKLNVLGSIGMEDEARIYLDQIVVMYPNETTPIIFKGDLALQDRNYTDAFACYEKAISADPKNAKLWIKKGDAYLLKSRTDMQQIRNMYQNLTEPSTKPGLTAASGPVDAFKDTQSFQEAMKAYNKAIALDPMTSIAISARIMSSYQEQVNSTAGILRDM
jgi:uncharacterized RDD family membrane protein YckC